MKKFKIFSVVAIVLTIGIWLFADNDEKPEVAAEMPKPQVKVSAPKQEVIERQITALGTVYANESVNLTANVTERISQLNFHEGELVEKGQVIARLEQDAELARLEEAKLRLKEEQRELARLEKLMPTQAVAQKTYDERKTTLAVTAKQLKQIQAELEDRNIRAPFSGILGLRQVSVGALVKPGDAITTLDEMSTLKLEFSVPVVYLQQLKEKLPVLATSMAFPQKQFLGEVYSIDTRVNEKTRTVKLKATIDNKELLLKPGMLLNVALLTDRRKAMLLPEEAVLQRSAKHYLYVVDKETLEVSERDVEVGQRQLGLVEILNGLEETDWVITRGVSKVSHGQAVEISSDEKKQG